ncbi:MAG: pilin [bacterium]|nr:pilin [bacterium]
MKKIILATLAMVLVGSFSLAVLQTQNAMAACEQNGSSLLGLPAWYRGLVNDSDCSIKKISQDGKDGGVSIQQFVWTVVGNIFDAIFRVIGVVAVGYIIWAGFQYMLSAGNSSKMSAAKTTLTNAIIGLIVALVASAVVQLVMGVF